MTAARGWRDLDWRLLVLALSLGGLGILQIYSATLGTRWASAWWRQSLYLAAGLGVMYLVSWVDYHSWLDKAPLLYLLSVVGLVGVLLLGRQVFGSRRWIPLPGGFTFQISEFGKIVLILLIARYLSDLRTPRPSLADAAKLGALVGVPLLLVAKQPDLGTAITYAVIVVAGLFFAGLGWRHWALGLALAAVLAAASPLYLTDYQKARIESFRNPANDPLGSGYQVLQSMIAVGSGGIWGKGATQGSQTQLRFLPVPHTDFILAAFAEEHGFLGVTVVLGLYFLLLMQIVQVAQMAPDRAGMYVCMGVGALLLFQLFVNVGMLVGRMVVTGLPLPLMSYGGSSVLATFAMLGLVNNVRLQRLVH
jgi:rod shape determining protein RodA